MDWGGRSSGWDRVPGLDVGVLAGALFPAKGFRSRPDEGAGQRGEALRSFPAERVSRDPAAACAGGRGNRAKSGEKGRWGSWQPPGETGAPAVSTPPSSRRQCPKRGTLSCPPARAGRFPALLGGRPARSFVCFPGRRPGEGVARRFHRRKASGHPTEPAPGGGHGGCPHRPRGPSTGRGSGERPGHAGRAGRGGFRLPGIPFRRAAGHGGFGTGNGGQSGAAGGKQGTESPAERAERSRG